MAVVAVAWIGYPTELQVELIQEDGISPLGPITLEFNQPINVTALSVKLSFEPQGVLAVEAISPRRVSIVPDRVIRPEEPATLRISSGIFVINGESLRAEVNRLWSFLGAGRKPFRKLG
jgi:hypothetical protein